MLRAHQYKALSSYRRVSAHWTCVAFACRRIGRASRLFVGMPSTNETAIEDTLNEYLGGGEESQEMVTAAYGDRDPWRRMPGGIQHVTDTLLHVSSDPSDYPELGGGGIAHSGILLGRLVAASSLAAQDRNDIHDFMSLCRQTQLPFYLAALKSTGAELGPDTNESPAGQMRPSDERAVIAQTGMPSIEVVACTFACATFRVPTVRELKAIGHGTDPVSHASFAKQRKIGLKTYIDYKKPEDAYALREALKKAARQLQNDGWHTAAEFRVQSLFEPTKGKPTEIAL